MAPWRIGFLQHPNLFSGSSRIGAGAEFNVSSYITLTPFVHGKFYGSGSDSGTLAYGLKAHAWLGRHWAFNAAVQRNDDGDMSYRLGLGVRF